MSKKADEKSLKQWLRQNDHIQKLQGKDYVLLSGLLALSHEHGLQSLTTTPTHIDIERGEAVFRCEAAGERGSFTGHGDAFASQPYQNVGKMVSAAFIRMAETRSVCRALRFYLGIGMTARDELPGREDREDAGERGSLRNQPGKKTSPATADSTVGTGEIIDRIKEECESQGIEYRWVEEFYNAQKAVELIDVSPEKAINFLAYVKGKGNKLIKYIENAKRAENEMREANK